MVSHSPFEEHRASTVLDSGDFDRERIAIATSAMISLVMLWCIRFDYGTPTMLTRNAFLWGYGHALLWASIAAAGTRIGVCIDRAMRETDLSRSHAQLRFAIPMAWFCFSLWAFHDFTESIPSLCRLGTLIVAVFVLVTAWTPYTPRWIALLLVVLALAKGEHTGRTELAGS